MITAYGEDESLQMAESLGTRLLNKPVMLDALKRAIEEMATERAKQAPGAS